MFDPVGTQHICDTESNKMISFALKAQTHWSNIRERAADESWLLCHLTSHVRAGHKLKNEVNCPAQDPFPSWLFSFTLQSISKGVRIMRGHSHGAEVTFISMFLHSLATTKTGFEVWRSSWGLSVRAFDVVCLTNDSHHQTHAWMATNWGSLKKCWMIFLPLYIL